MAGNEVMVDWQSLKEFTTQVFARAGMPVEGAAIEADALIWANLRGVDSHGVLRIPWYLENIDKGLMNPKPNIRIVKETAATYLIDADRALGPVATVFAMKKVIEKAKGAGIGWAVIRSLTHQGALGYYSLMAAEQGMAGILTVSSPPNMAPFGAAVAGVHNSPISIAVPAKRHPPLCLDMATSVVAGGKVWLAVDKGTSIPEGWGQDKEGNVTTDPIKVSSLLPAGRYKGSGLALMFECLSSVMVDNPLLEPVLLGMEGKSAETEKQPQGSTARPATYGRRHRQNGLVVAIDISNFIELESYKEHIDNLIDGLKALPKAKGVTEIMVPGEPENRNLEERLKNGIPLPEGTVRNLRGVASRFSLELPPGF